MSARWPGRYGSRLSRGGGLLWWGGQPEPVEPVPTQGEEIRELADGGERDPAEQLDGDVSLPPTQVQLDRLGEPREVVDAHDHVAGSIGGVGLARVGQHRGVRAAEVEEVA